MRHDTAPKSAAVLMHMYASLNHQLVFSMRFMCAVRAVDRYTPRCLTMEGLKK